MSSTGPGIPQPQEAVARAEELVRRFEERAGPFVARLLGRTREELEDIWAEVEAIRESKRSTRGTPRDKA